MFWKNINGRLKTVAYYRENNPKPYDFKSENYGLSVKELDNIFSEDFHDIIIELKPKDRSLYILMVQCCILCLNIPYIILGVLNYYF